jgi:hypothetical protein
MPEQQQRYQAAYCGLCRAIGDRHGQKARLSLTYDMAFLVLLLESLYEPEQQQGEGRCAPHPVHPKAWSRSSVTDYAADMNVALSYYKCLDDWADDKSLPKLAYAKALKSRYCEIKTRWPRQCQAMEQELDALSALEEGKSPDLDGCCRCFGRLMGELFVYYEDRWSEDLRLLGEKLGQFIYLMDAVLDRQQDDKRGRYNPVTAFEAEYGTFSSFPVLTMLIGDGSLAFERLPLEQDLPLLRNILYSGVWIHYANARNQNPPGKEEPSK